MVSRAPFDNLNFCPHYRHTHPRISDPPVCLHQSSGTKIRVLVPPVGWAGSRTASAENALVHSVEFAAIFRRLEEFTYRNGTKQSQFNSIAVRSKNRRRTKIPRSKPNDDTVIDRASSHPPSKTMVFFLVYYAKGKNEEMTYPSREGCRSATKVGWTCIACRRESCRVRDP